MRKFAIIIIIAALLKTSELPHCITHCCCFAGAMASFKSQFGVGRVPIVMDEVRCLGSEKSLLNCTFLTSHDCTHDEDAGVVCLTGEFGNIKWHLLYYAGVFLYIKHVLF